MKLHNALTLAFAMIAMTASAQNPQPHKWAIVLHGGAGIIERKNMTPEAEKAYRTALEHVLQTGADVLAKGGSAVDAIEASIKLMEDDPLFNCGRGAVFTAAGRNELDSAIMDGSNLKAGAVAGVTTTRHPISLARAVMDRSPHVMLIGSGADQFAMDQGIEQVAPSYFFTERRWQQLVKALKEQGKPVPPRPVGAPPEPSQPITKLRPDELPAAAWPDESKTHKFGTVGVVALDRNGNIAAGTSTGGTTAKLYGRVGDSPLIGAGTYASNQSCAVSATGTGEYFIRLTVAREICALVQYKGMKLQQAADEVIKKQLTDLKGDGGIIAIAPDGQTAWSFNTSGMYRARLIEGGKPQVGIFSDEP